MDLPRHSTDLAIVFPCSACNGNGGFGIRKPDSGNSNAGIPPARSNFTPCTTCDGSGWKLKRPGELTPAELARLLSKLPSPP